MIAGFAGLLAGALMGAGEYVSMKGLRMLAIAAVAAAITFTVGKLLGVAVS